MKKVIVFLIGSVAAFLALLAVVIYRWTITPYGRLNPVMAVMHKLMQSAPLETMLTSGDVATARRFMDLVKPRVPIDSVEDRLIDGPGGSIPLRIYRPPGNGPFPVIVFFHGGGFILGSIASHENVCRGLAMAGPALVISVDYRLAPEHPYPAALDDAYAAVKWAVEQAASLGGDPAELVVAGDSAGGNLASAVSLKARDEKGPAIRLQLLLYAALMLDDIELESRRNFDGYILKGEVTRQMRDMYVPDPAAWRDPYVSPFLAEGLGKLPPAYIMTAEFDPLRDEARCFAEHLQEDGVPVVYHEYKGMLHGFLSLADVLALIPAGDRLLKTPDEVYSEIGSVLTQTFSSS